MVDIPRKIVNIFSVFQGITFKKELKMKASVVEDLCIGCQACVDTCDTVFKMDGDKAVVITDTVPADAEESCQEAAETCPVDAIICE